MQSFKLKKALAKFRSGLALESLELKQAKKVQKVSIPPKKLEFVKSQSIDMRSSSNSSKKSVRFYEDVPQRTNYIHTESDEEERSMDGTSEFISPRSMGCDTIEPMRPKQRFKPLRVKRDQSSSVESKRSQRELVKDFD